MITPTEAQTIILSKRIGLDAELVSIDTALHYSTAEAWIADSNIPPFNRVMMDGIGVRYIDLLNGTTQFRCVGIHAAGAEPLLSVKKDECLEIMTGAACPPSIDVIIPYEDLKRKSDLFEIENGKSYRKEQNIQLIGAEAKVGEILFSEGNIIDASAIGLAASIGKTQILVYKKPRILIWTTGDELVAADQQPKAWQIRASNGHALLALLQSSNFEADLFHTGDNPETIRKSIAEKAHNYDVMILTGGVSKGKYDHIPEALQSHGISEHFHRIAQKPGKPMWFGSNENTVVFGLPGNPVSCFMCMVRYVLPWLEAQYGRTRRLHKMKWKVPMNKSSQLTHYVPVRCDWSTDEIHPIPYRGSGDFSSLVHADAFAEIPADVFEIAAGEVCDCYLIPGRITF
jgi:molybdopterin molybdotransferase